HTGKNHEPEDNLLSGVELLRRRVAAGKHATALEEPDDVMAAWEIVDEPQSKHQHKRDHEPEGDIVVQPLAGERDCAECVGADHGFESIPAVKRIKPGESQDDE